MEQEKTNWAAIKDLIYSRVYIPSIFSEVLGIIFDPRRRYVNPLRPSKTPDSGFFRDKINTDIWYFKDFASGEVLDIFGILKAMYGYSFVEAVTWIGNTYCLNDDLGTLGFKSSSLRSSNSMAYLDMLRAQKKKIEYPIEPETPYPYGWDNNIAGVFHCQGYKIVIYESPLLEHTDFWNAREMSMPENCFAVEEFISESGKVIFRESYDDPIFFFLDNINKCGQIYKPYGTKASKFRNLGSAVFQNLIYSQDYAIRVKSFKEFDILNHMGFQSFGMSGEGGSFPIKNYSLFRYKYIIIAYDSDEAGIKAAKKAILETEKAGIKAYSINMSQLEFKDIDDAVRSFGIQPIRKYIKHLIKKEIKAIKP
jgi:Toprim-like